MYLYPLPEFHSGSGSATTSAQPIGPSRRVYRHVTIKADADNTGPIYVGPSTVKTSGFKLAAGDEVAIPVDDVAAVHVVAEAAQSYSWISI